MISAVVSLLALILFAGADPASAQSASRVRYQIIVHESNLVATLGRAELREIFLGRRARWADGSEIRPVDLSPAQPIRAEFSREVLGLTPRAVSVYWMQEIFAGGSRPPTVVSSAAAVVAFVAANPRAIGYVPVNLPTPGVRTLTIVP